MNLLFFYEGRASDDVNVVAKFVGVFVCIELIAADSLIERTNCIQFYRRCRIYSLDGHLVRADNGDEPLRE